MASTLTIKEVPNTGPYSVSGKGKHKGPTALALKRTMKRAGYGFKNSSFDEMDNSFNKSLELALNRAFKDGANGYGEGRWKKVRALKLSDGTFAMDSFSRSIIQKEAQEPKNEPLKKARALLAFCRTFNGPYIYGAEHDGSFLDDKVSDAFDCSSSVSYALWKFDLLGSNRSQVSNWFEWWGDSGRGEYITIHANSEHVWMEFTLPEEGYFRFDTSPHGDGPRGARVRTRRRFDSSFTHRHPKGF